MSSVLTLYFATSLAALRASESPLLYPSKLVIRGLRCNS
jgi:hypothetical protein